MLNKNHLTDQSQVTLPQYLNITSYSIMYKIVMMLGM